MRTCLACGGESKDGARFCRICGFEFPTDEPSSVSSAYSANAQGPIYYAGGVTTPAQNDNQFMLVDAPTKLVPADQRPSETSLSCGANKNILIIGGVIVVVLIVAVIAIVSLRNSPNAPIGVGPDFAQTNITDQSGMPEAENSSDTSGGQDTLSLGADEQSSASATTGEASGDINAPDYVMFSNSSTQMLTSDDVSSLSAWELSVARNEIYARHGYVFKKNIQIKAYFENKSWYHEVPAFRGADSDLSSIELANVKLIQAQEKSTKGQ